MRLVLAFCAGVAALLPDALPAQRAGTPVAPALLPALQQHIVGGPWAARRPAANRCPKLYMLGSRRCPFCRAFLQQALLPLDRAGYDVRLHTGFMNNESRLGLAEVAVRRNVLFTLRHHLVAEANGMPEHRWDAGRVNAFNAMLDAQETYERISRAAGFAGALPGFVWLDQAGRWRVHSGFGTGTAASLIASLPTPPAGCAEASARGQ